MQVATTGHPYLERERALPGALLALGRFAGRVRIDFAGNAVFPHFDGQGLSGYELKNIGFTGFASGGSKALWLSDELPDDNRLVVCESAIDALSHAVLFPDDRALYASIGGNPNPQQPELIRAAVARMPMSSEIVAAVDADAGGGKLPDVVRRAVELSGRHDLKFTVQEPLGYKDWNDQLRRRSHPLLPYRPEVPAVTGARMLNLPESVPDANMKHPQRFQPRLRSSNSPVSDLGGKPRFATALVAAIEVQRHTSL